jgi:hypothetical protein
MDLRRLRPAEYVMTAASLALVVSLFLPWYSVPTVNGHPVTDGWTAYAPVHFGSSSFAGWHAFAAVDVILVACAAVALLVVFLQATQRTPALPIVSSVASTWTGLVAVVIVALNVIDRPDRFADTRYGAWIGLVAAVAMLAGSWWGMRDERTGLRDRRSHLESSG